MGLGILSASFILLTWLINETMDESIRIYTLLVFFLVWLCLSPVFIGTELTAIYNQFKKRLK